MTLTKEDLELRQKPLLKRCMQKWLPAHDALLEMLVQHLPSPARAQKYRADALYTGPTDDKWCTAIRNCDPNGPLMLYPRAGRSVLPTLRAGTCRSSCRRGTRSASTPSAASTPARSPPG